MDTALLLVVDAYDAARVHTATKLFALYDTIEARREACELDASSFVAAIRGFDAGATDDVAVDILLQCQQEAAREWAAASAEDQASMDPEAIPRSAFLRACEDHGLRPTDDGANLNLRRDSTIG